MFCASVASSAALLKEEKIPIIAPIAANTKPTGVANNVAQNPLVATVAASVAPVSAINAPVCIPVAPVSAVIATVFAACAAFVVSTDNALALFISV